MPPKVVAVRRRSPIRMLARSLSQCVRRPNMTDASGNPATLNICWNCRSRLGESGRLRRQLRGLDIKQQNTAETPDILLPNLPLNVSNSLRDRRHAADVAVADLVRVARSAKENPRFQALDGRLHLTAQIQTLAITYRELMEFVESICHQFTAQTEAYERTRADLAKLTSFVASADVDGFADETRINNDIRELKEMIVTFDSQDQDYLPPIMRKSSQTVLTQAQVALAQKLHLQTQVLNSMKRRLSNYRNAAPAQSDFVDHYGSVENIDARIQSLSTENAQLRLREKRFHHDQLLKRRPYGSASLLFLHCLICALQNELCSCRSQINEETEAMTKHNTYEDICVLDTFETTHPIPSSCDTIEIHRRLELFMKKFRSALDHGDLGPGNHPLLKQAADQIEEASTALGLSNVALMDLSEICQSLGQKLNESKKNRSQ